VAARRDALTQYLTSRWSGKLRSGDKHNPPVEGAERVFGFHRRHAKLKTQNSKLKTFSRVPRVDNSSIWSRRATLKQNFASSASKIVYSLANLIDRSGVWRVEMGRDGVKWFKRP
jgi:hypothetical protein